MGVYERVILPRLIDRAMRDRSTAKERKKALEDVQGEVLEIGFGSGLNLSHYRDGVTRLVGVDPSKEMWKLAQPRVEAVPFAVEHHLGDAAQLPDLGTFDVVVSTFTLCSIPDLNLALSKICGALKPGGRFVFLEHGASSEPRIRWWQDKLTPLQRRLGGGCHLNRDIPSALEKAGLRPERLQAYYMKGPKPFCYLYRGSAQL